MKIIETTADVTADHELRLQLKLPKDVPPGEHRIVVTIDESLHSTANLSLSMDWPVHDAGLLPPDRSLHREDIYDDGR